MESLTAFAWMKVGYPFYENNVAFFPHQIKAGYGL